MERLALGYLKTTGDKLHFQKCGDTAVGKARLEIIEINPWK
jgi:hypothetical protein